jgi:hypothetical protein
VSLKFVTTSAELQPLALDVAPVGWQGLRYLFARDTLYHGVMLTGSASLTFWKTGAAYLRTLYEGGVVAGGQVIPAGGIDAVCAVNVFERDPNEFRNALALRQQVDFTTYRSSAQGVEVKLKETGFATSVLARADSEVDLFGVTSLGGGFLAPPAPVSVRMHSQMLRLKYEASQKLDLNLSPGLMFSNDGDLSHEQLLYFGFDTQADNDFGLEPVGGGFIAAGETGSDSAAPIYVAKENGTFKVSLKLSAHVEAHTQKVGLATRQFRQVETKYHLRVSGNDAQTIELAPPKNIEGLDGDYEEDINIQAVTYTFDLKVGDAIYLYADYYVHRLNATNLDPYQATLTARIKAGSYLRITAESTTRETNCVGVYIYEALKHLVAAMTDGGEFYSEYFGRTDTFPAYAVDGPGSRRFLTNGFCLRGFPLPTDFYAVADDGIDPRKPFTGSFSKVYSSLDAIDCLGLGIEQRNGKPTLRIEPRSHWFQSKESLSLGVVQNPSKTPYIPGFHNEVHVGYQRWQSGAAVGLDEFNGQRTYALPLTSQKATYSVLSDLITAGYLIEQTRRKQFVMGTNAEGNADQDLFLISLNRSASGQLITEKNEAFSSVTGILSPETTYNLRLSPGRMLRQHGGFVRAGLAPQAAAGKSLLLTKVEGNDKLTTQLRTEPALLDEHAPLAITDLAEPIYVAEQYEFTAKLRRQQVRRLMKNPYGRISFLDGKGQRKSGYVLKVECAPESGQASFTLLRAA